MSPASSSSQALPPFGLAADVMDRMDRVDGVDAVGGAGGAEKPAAAEPGALARYVETVGLPAAEPAHRPESFVQLVTFRLDDELHALPIERVREIVRADGLTRVPQAPRHVRGLKSLRGALLPVLEVRTRLGLAPATLTPASRILVVEGRRRLLGLLVDAACQVARVPRSAVQPPPPEVVSRMSRHVVGVVRLEPAMALLLDVEALLVVSKAEEEAAP
ncbi:MAG TPA: chemotaxis protein CheW [Myxococcales bacterium]|jgi:purine-binding chemotaxis protein CheW